MTGRAPGPRPPLRLVDDRIDDGPPPLRAIAVRDPRLQDAYRKLAIAERARKRTIYANWALIVVCGCQAAAIAVLAPLGENAPARLAPPHAAPVNSPAGDEAGQIHSFLAAYVQQREALNARTAGDAADRIALWSLGPARDALAPMLEQPASVTVQIRDVESIDRRTARVLFTASRAPPGLPQQTGDWQALLTYQAAGAPLRADDSGNPLGIQITSYRREAIGVRDQPTTQGVSLESVAPGSDDGEGQTPPGDFVLSIDPPGAAAPRVNLQSAPRAKPSQTAPADVIGPTE